MAGMEDVLADPETEEVLAEFDFLVSESGEGAGEARSQGDGTEWGKYYLKRRKIKDKKTLSVCVCVNCMPFIIFVIVNFF